MPTEIEMGVVKKLTKMSIFYNFKVKKLYLYKVSYLMYIGPCIIVIVEE